MLRYSIIRVVRYLFYTIDIANDLELFAGRLPKFDGPIFVAGQQHFLLARRTFSTDPAFKKKKKLICLNGTVCQGYSMTKFAVPLRGHGRSLSRTP